MSDFHPQIPPPAALEGPLPQAPLPRTVWVVRPPRRRYWLHLLLLVLTLLTTLTVGARLQVNFDHARPAYSSDTDLFPAFWVLARPARLLLGVPFSLTLLLILLAHEMGHFVYSRRNHVYATLPFFLPAPTLIGTMGAFILIRSPIPSRRALFDIGIAGPIAGFLVAVPALALGMACSRVAPELVAASQVQFGLPLVCYLLRGLAPPGAAPLSGLDLHPIALAAWVGMFATALNLIPGGQLDGGHIVYALFPRAHRWVSRACVLLLAACAFFWTGWLLWGAAVLVTGTRHPSVPLEPRLDSGRKLLALLALLIFMVTFMPAPLPGYGAMQVLRNLLHGN